MTPLLAETLTDTAKSLSNAGGWTVVIVLVLSGGWAVFVKRMFILRAELDNEKAERAKDNANWQARLEAEKSQCADEQKIWRERYEELKAESVSRLGMIREEKDYWRDVAMKATNVATVATNRAASSGG